MLAFEGRAALAVVLTSGLVAACATGEITGSSTRDAETGPRDSRAPDAEPRDADATAPPDADARPRPDADASASIDADASALPDADASAVPDADASVPDAEVSDAGGNNPFFRSSARMYWWGHSLVEQTAAAEEGSGPDANRFVALWVEDLADSAGLSMCGVGMYSRGLAPTNFDGYPGTGGDWIDQWGRSPSCWSGSWAATNFDTGIIMENNFVRPPEAAAAGAAADLLQRARTDEPGLNYLYLYETWPEWQTFDDAGFDRWRNGDGTAYGAQLRTLLTDINALDPTLNVKLIPVNSAFVALFETGGPLDDFDFRDFAIDGAPHGEATTYFLSGLVHFMTIYGQRPPANYTVPSFVDSRVRSRFNDVVDECWAVVQANR